jgi:drug/metabolite transporter (DMT)-like permease
MSLLFGVVAAVLLGMSDFCAARASRTVSSVSVTRTALGISMCLAPLLLLVKPVEWTTRDVLLSGISGIAMTAGLLLLYRGYSVARMGIVAPTSSVLLTSVPIVYDLVQGVTPEAVAALGMLVGLAALVLTSYTPGGSGSAELGLLFGIGSGVLFGIAFTLMGSAAESAGLMPVLVQRGFGFLLMVLIVPFFKVPFLVTAVPARWYTLAAACFATCAVGSLQFAFGDGATGLVSVAASQFAAVAVILAVVFDREHLRWWQTIGVFATAVGVALMALG